ncbi:DUF551 domain-containing protein [Salmonella enterica]|nr:DUF551 domain-containing protein [Salmonella enterica]EGL2447404.1 DUF551 domain-containing protein [Salmonella enterica]
MSTITRERLLKIQQWRETYGAGSNVMLPAEEAEELARIALAALEAAPEPVVPESISVRQAISALESADCVTTIGQAYKIGWNACRAAMLQSKYRDLSQPVDPQISEYEKIMLQAGNSPVIPDGWISCSERMPDKLIPVIVMYEDGEMWSAMWNGNRWDDGTEYPDPHSVTHWREMPAAPQQEVNRG